MKKFRLFLALLVLIGTCISLLPAQTQAASESDLTFYKFRNVDQYYVDDCNGSASGSLTVPATYNGMPVTHIETQAFEYCSELTEIIISDGVTHIMDFAFQSCNKLTSVKLPDSIVHIDKAAFKGCSKLSDITIPDGVKRIESGTFYGCTSLTSMALPDSVYHIDSIAFQYCSNLVSIKLPEKNCYIYQYAFDGCSKLSGINIPAGMTKIAQYTFNNCKNMTSISIPASVTHIDHHAFNNCTRLNEVIFCGTEEQWNNINIDGYNTSLTNAPVRFHDWVGSGTQKTCTICKLTTDGHDHIWKAATCTTPKTCTICSLTEGSPIAHSYNSGVVTKPATCKEEGIRLYTCTGCSATKTGTIDKLTTHTYQNQCDASCDVCGQVRTINHNYQPTWSQDSAYHWHECTVCANKSDSSLHIPGAAATELTPQTCTVCGYLMASALGTQGTVPSTTPTTPPSTQPATTPVTQPATAPTTQPLTEPTAQPSAPSEPEQSADAPGISLVQMLLIMLAEAAILTGVFLILWKKKAK